ncbi:hypothetical protein E1J38_007990 [Seonamhaeicola sediminis]|uniref:Lipoprotein n=1 Tax=Seonamhaeicola sediminis TaxID=2528206 RepID=A0A562YDT8_9FLAO|nr:hypothetical protein [Seonamhaeicola sediminis]TWO32798.1 hypothetical protein E1J38_007990 [Seonamhaeicola sediminis]
MKAIKTHLKAVAVFFSILIFFQGCTVYKSANVTLDEAAEANTKVRIKTIDNKSFRFDKIEVIKNKIFGININSGERSIVSIKKDNIDKIQVKDKTGSTIVSIAVPLVLGVVMLGIIVNESLNNMSFDLSN